MSAWTAFRHPKMGQTPMTVTSQKLTDSTAAASFDPYKVRADFPILQTTVSPADRS